jgi:hypothetical protein
MRGGGSSGKANLEQLVENDQEGSSLEAILQDPDLLSECKWGNQKVIK